MNSVNVNLTTYVNFIKENNKEGSKFKVSNHVRISKYKNIFPNCSEEIFVIKKVKNTVPWPYLINDFNGEKIVGTFYEKELQKTNQKEFRVEKVKNIKWKDIVQMSEYFPKPKSLGENVKVELVLSNHATKGDLKNATGVDTSHFAI